MKLNVTVEVDLPEDFDSFQDVEEKIRGVVFKSGQDLMNQAMEKYEVFILEKKKRFWKKDMREKRFQTILGEVKRRRWRVFDWKEKRDRYPLDEWMGTERDGATPALKKSLVTAVVQRSYRQATKEVERWTGVKRSPMTNWKLVQKIAGRRLKKSLLFPTGIRSRFLLWIPG